MPVLSSNDLCFTKKESNESLLGQRQNRAIKGVAVEAEWQQTSSPSVCSHQTTSVTFYRRSAVTRKMVVAVVALY